MVKWSQTREVLLCALCNEYQKNDDADVVECGLETGHAYSLLDARSNLDVKLVCLREPFGCDGWNGDWSHKSKLWTEKAKTHFGVKDMEDNGTFWMAFDDFLQYFSSLALCYCGTDENPIVTSSIGIDIGLEQKENDLILPLITVKVPNNSAIEWIGLHQQDIRNPDTKSYLDMSLFVYKETNNNVMCFSFFFSFVAIALRGRNLKS